MVAAPAAFAITLLAGCGGSGGPAATPVTAPTGAAAATSSAEAVRARALTATEQLHSYTFASTETVGADTTRVSGRTVLPAALDYLVSKGTTQQEVIRFTDASFVRTVPGTWKQLAHPAPARSPLAGLEAALAKAGHLAVDTSGTRLTGSITASDAAAAGLLTAGASSADIPVVFGLDPTGHVTSFALSTTLSVGGKQLALTERTAYSGFDQAAPIPRP